MATTIVSDDNSVEEAYDELSYIADAETTCKICHAEFLDSEDLKVHVQQMHAETTSRPKFCQFCDANYTDLEDYARHIRDRHLLTLKCCRFCTKCFMDQRTVKKHEKSHNGQSQLYACSQCPGLLTTPKELECHEKIYHDNDLDGVFLKCMPHLSAILTQNILSLLQSEEQVLTCRACEFTGFDTSSYLQHLKNDKCSVLVCDKCNEAFKHRKSLVKHLQCKYKCMDLTEYVRDLTTCPTCESEVHIRHMGKHIKHCKGFACYTCNIKFDSIVELSAHQSSTHPSELDVLICKYCGKEYVGQHSLDKHVERSHRHQFALYKYECKSCGAIFKHPQQLFAHYFTKHKDLEPYTCRICDKKFRIRKRFTIHIKLEHKSEGVVEFDDKYHVFFAEKKSEKPFIPTCVIPELVPSETNTSSNVKKTNDHSKKTSKQDPKDLDSLRLSTIETEDGEENLETDKEYRIKKLKNTRKRAGNKNIIALSSSSEDEAEPLIMIKKKAQRKLFRRRFLPGTRNKKLRRNQFTCKVCKKYCYTYQNFHNHIKMHKKNEFIQCVKCSRSFPTTDELSEHVATAHATSRLTETLKSLRERKQVTHNTIATNDTSYDENLEPWQRFQRTIKRIKPEKPSEPAKITISSDNISVKKFIENFIPEVNETESKEAKSDSVTIKLYTSPYYTKPTIKMHRFTPEPPIHEVKLKMPERFKDEDAQRVRLKVRLVQQPIKPSVFEAEDTYGDNDDRFQEYDDYEEFKNDTIPDVAQEVMLEGTEEPPRPIMQNPQKIVIPQLPKGYKNIHIATLTNEAPYYKIIKVDGNKSEPIIINTDSRKETEKEIAKVKSKDDDIIRLPDGTKFVTANPLAHLLGDKAAEIFEPVKSRYKPLRTDFKGMLVEALQNLDKPQARAVKRKNESQEKVERPKKVKAVKL